MKIKKFNKIEEKKEKEEKKQELKLADYKELFNQIYDVLETYPKCPIEAVKTIKDMKFKLDNVTNNVLYFYNQSE